MNQIRIQLNYGTIAGLLTFAAFLVFYFAGYNPLGAIKWLSLVFPIVLILMGVRKVRDAEFDGILSFRKGLSIGWFITMIYASLVGMLIYLYGMLISDEFCQLHISETVAGLETAREILGSEQVDEAIQQMKDSTLADIAFGDFSSKMLGGLFISLIIAAILRKRAPKLPHEATEAVETSE